ncbi:MAG: hypothetical protein ACRCYO_18195, partial [Bacteroidia bacterium]
MKKLILICFLLACVSADATNNAKLFDWVNFKGYGFRAGYGYQRGHFLELHAFRYYTNYKENTKIPMLGYVCWGGGGEIELAKNPTFSIKAYSEFAISIYGGRLSFCYSRNKISQGLLVTPEAGITIFGTAYCYLGYAIPVYRIGEEKFHGLRLSIGFSIVDV